MKKTRLMFEVEERIGESLKDYFEMNYNRKHKSTGKISKELNINKTTIWWWLKKFNIDIRDSLTSRLPKNFKKPSKEELKKLYVDGNMSCPEIGKKIGVSYTTVGEWLKKYKIPIRTFSEVRLPKGVKKPSKEELKKLYVDGNMSCPEIGKKIGVSSTTIYRFLKEYEIPIRTFSEVRLPKGVKKPSKEELKKLYVDGNMSCPEIGKKIGVSHSTIMRWLNEYEIVGKKLNSQQFIDFLKSDETAKKLAIAATIMKNQKLDVESIILDIYQGKFKDEEHLHSLLEKNAKEIYDFVQEGITNLGVYLGRYNVGDINIIPILIGEAIFKIPENKINQTLEERLTRILRGCYSPRFNSDPENTIKEIEKIIVNSEGSKKNLYQKLHDHYKEVLELAEEIS